MSFQGGETVILAQSSKHRKPKSREVSSRFLQSPLHSNTPSSSSFENVIQSPSRTLSPLRQKPKSTTDTRKPKSQEKSGFIRGLWPSASATSTTTSSSQASPNPKAARDTLADHLGNERLMDHIVHHKNREKPENPAVLSRQSSYAESQRYESERELVKENHKPLFGASMRYTGKFRFPGKSSSASPSSSSSKSRLSPKLPDDHGNNIAPGRLSVDETALRKRQTGRKSNYLADILVDSESENSATSIGSPVIGRNSPASYMAPTVSSRMSGNSHDGTHRPRRWSAESSPLYKRASGDHSPKKNSLKSMNRSNSLITNNPPVNESSSRYRSSPGRPVSPTSMEDNKGKTMPSSITKPPASPSVTKGVGNLITIGLELLKGKKSSSDGTSPRSLGIGESVHQLRMMHNRHAQWSYANAKAEAIQRNNVKQVETNLTKALGSLTKLQHSVRVKKLQLQKEKLDMKLNYIIHSQMKLLEEWNDAERRHISAVNMTKDCLNSVVCSVPLVEGAKVNPRSISRVFQDASDLTASIKLLLSDFPPMAEQNATAFSELAGLVSQEKLLLQECLELFKSISALEVQESSLKCSVLQLKLTSEEQNQTHQEHLEIFS